MRSILTEDLRHYFSSLEQGLAELYAIAKRARAKAIDPSTEPEPRIARDLAERVEELVGPKGVAKRIRELGKKLSREALALKIAEEIIYGVYGRLDDQQAAEQAIRTCLAILTEGITAAPLEGITRVDIRRNPDRTRHLAIYFAGPIRSAGGTEQGLILVIADYIRRLLGLSPYKPTEEEIRRFIEEIRAYERYVARFQFSISDEHIRVALHSLPIEVTGVGTHPIEVSSFRNLPRIETNRLRGGALLALNDGLLGRSRKIANVIEELGIDGWGWLKLLCEEEKAPAKPPLKKVIVGRPILSSSLKIGGFRLRYGRCRNTGLATVGIHTATMTILRNFLAVGTQLRIEKPGKASIVMPVDTIEPPIVKLKDGSVIRVESVEKAKEIQGIIDKILFVGDILIPFGDFLENNEPLDPSPFCEEWWARESICKISEKFRSIGEAALKAGIPEELLKEFFLNYLKKPTAEEAALMSQRLGIPLHPRYTYFWNAITLERLLDLRKVMLKADKAIEDGIAKEIRLPLTEETKRTLEDIAIPHLVVDGKIVITKEEAPAFALSLGLNRTRAVVKEAETALEGVRELSGIDIRNKALAFIGVRMGRPEKAQERRMKPSAHVLFPIGSAGGPQRNVIKASEKGVIKVSLVRRKCVPCNKITYTLRCQNCGSETELERICPICKRVSTEERCSLCRTITVFYDERPLALKELINNACEKSNLKPPDLVKGVKTLANKLRVPEPIEKGILRSKHDIYVFKDGTIRFDSTNAPLTHFKPKEIGTFCEKLKELGYDLDYKGDPLHDPEQLCELKIQDLIIPRKAAKYLIRVARFIDELLQNVYGLPPFYNLASEEDLVGHLVIGLAPHTSVGILGRIIGFTSADVCFAHPYFHAAKRRDCDGDEDALMLALDVLINFSKDYLPDKVGGVMDVPLLIIPVIDPKEVDKEAHNMDVSSLYPLLFYEKTLEAEDPTNVNNLIDLISYRLGTSAQYVGFGYTHETSDIDAGNVESAYKRLKTMEDKLAGQIELAEMIRSVDTKALVTSVLLTHLIPDIVGNLKTFASQKFRCKSCNRKFRRYPLKGSCPHCGESLTLTVHKGGIEKYLSLVDNLLRKYGLDHLQDRTSLIKDQIDELFALKERKQLILTDFM